MDYQPERPPTAIAKKHRVARTVSVYTAAFLSFPPSHGWNSTFPGQTKAHTSTVRSTDPFNAETRRSAAPPNSRRFGLAMGDDRHRVPEGSSARPPAVLLCFEGPSSLQKERVHGFVFLGLKGKMKTQGREMGDLQKTLTRSPGHGRVWNDPKVGLLGFGTTHMHSPRMRNSRNSPRVVVG